jgi:hypothetical protein
MNSRTKRVNSGANSPQQRQFESVPRSLVKVGLALPLNVHIGNMEWSPMPVRTLEDRLLANPKLFRAWIADPLRTLKPSEPATYVSALLGGSR